MKSSVYILSLLSVIFITGCATVDQKISLGYSQVDRPFGRHSGTVVVAISPSKVSTKNDKGEIIVGALNNANGVHQANILADNSFEEWIMESLLRELQVLGFTARVQPQIPGDAQNGIQISNTRISLDVNQGIVSDDARQLLQFSVDLYSKGSKVKTFTVASRDTRIIPFSASRTELEKIMRSSLQEAMLQIIPEIISLNATK